MRQRTTLAQLVLGLQGLALLRGFISGSDDEAEARLTEIRRVAALGDDDPLSAPIEFPERSIEDGYAGWSKTYDSPGNALIHLEETVLWPLLASLPAGRALDAGCGTGRVTARLAAAGHDVVGIDQSSDMLDLARDKAAAAELRVGRLEALPVEDGSFDLVTCCLALDHCAQLGPPIAELARAARPGGRVIITDLHPFMVLLGGQAAYPDADGWAFVRAHAHLHRDYLRAFSDNDLAVEELLEPFPDREWFEMQPRAWEHAPEAFAQAFRGIPAAIVWSLVKR
jgi:ubiquinone/menaquinone biosynthesis C-methylase UbiE